MAKIDKARFWTGGFSYNGFSGSDCRPYHEYMRTSSHTHRRIIIAVIGLIVKVTRLYPPKKSEVFLWQKLIRQDFGRAFSTQRT